MVKTSEGTRSTHTRNRDRRAHEGCATKSVESAKPRHSECETGKGERPIAVGNERASTAKWNARAAPFEFGEVLRTKPGERGTRGDLRGRVEQRRVGLLQLVQILHGGLLGSLLHSHGDGLPCLLAAFSCNVVCKRWAVSVLRWTTKD